MQQTVILSAEELAKKVGSDYSASLIEGIRQALLRGLSEEFIRSSVRINDFTNFGGGLKAQLVGGVGIRFQAAVKVGGDDLRRDAQLMTSLQKNGYEVLPEVLELLQIRDDGDEAQFIMLMEQLINHETLFDKIFKHPLKRKQADKILDGVFKRWKKYLNLSDGVFLDHETGDNILDINDNPFPQRIVERLETILKRPRYKRLFDKSGKVDGEHCPPVQELCRKLEGKMTSFPKENLRPAHGDLHIKNVMFRPYGKGYRIRFIDPNAAVGNTTPFYDMGKLLHFLGPIGWLEAGRKIELDGVFKDGPSGWELSSAVPKHLRANRREHLRSYVERSARERMSKLSKQLQLTSNFQRDIELAVTAANVGLAYLYHIDDDGDESRLDMALACTLKPLLNWSKHIT